MIHILKIRTCQHFIVYVILFLCFGSSQAEIPDATKLAEKGLAATVYLEMRTDKNEIYGGSGFFVSPTHIVTNYHVIAGTDKGTVNRVDNPTKYTIQNIVAVDEENDLALLYVVIPNINPLPIGDSDKVRIGEQVYVTGNPKGQQGTFSGGMISRIQNGKKKRFQMTAPISPGSSGGPVLNNEGKVIGVTFMSIEGGQNLNFAIPSEYVKALLKKRSPIVDVSTIFAETHWKRGNTYFYFGSYEKSILEYDKAIRIKPDYASAYTNRGGAKMALGLHRDAIVDLNKAIHLDPNNSNSYYNRGGCMLKLGQYDNAIDDLDRAIELKPDSANSYAGRGQAKLRLEQYTQAILDLNEAIRLDPNNTSDYHNRGAAKFKLDQYTKAISDFDKAIRLDPHYVDAYLFRGFAKASLGLHRNAIDDYDKVIVLEPDKVPAYLNRGLAKMKLSQDAKAIIDYNLAIFFNPNGVHAYLYRGVAKDNLGQESEAQQDWRIALKLAEQMGDTELLKQIQQKLLLSK